MKKSEAPICKRSDKGVIAMWFDRQLGKYECSQFPSSLDFHKAVRADDWSDRYELIAWVEVTTDDRGYGKPGKLVPFQPLTSQELIGDIWEKHSDTVKEHAYDSESFYEGWLLGRMDLTTPKN